MHFRKLICDLSLNKCHQSSVLYWFIDSTACPVCVLSPISLVHSPGWLPRTTSWLTNSYLWCPTQPTQWPAWLASSLHNSKTADSKALDRIVIDFWVIWNKVTSWVDDVQIQRPERWVSYLADVATYTIYFRRNFLARGVGKKLSANGFSRQPGCNTLGDKCRTWSVFKLTLTV